MVIPSEPGVRRALIVDDSHASAERAAVVLAAAGWEFDVARDGFEAIIFLRHAAYQTVLLDYRMPGMSGVEVMEWIRRNVPKAPAVIVMSSDSPDLVAQRFGGLGVKAVLSKPVAANDLYRAIDQAVGS